MEATKEREHKLYEVDGRRAKVTESQPALCEKQREERARPMVFNLGYILWCTYNIIYILFYGKHIN
jgi:hypothetical protein